jgi:hypothetical protein
MVLAVVLAFVVLAGSLAFYWRRQGRIRRLAGAGSWATACVDPTNPRAWRALVIDGAGLHLERSNGREENSWTWSTIRRATTGPVRPIASAVPHTGLQVMLTDGTAVEFLFPSRSTLRYPSELLQRVMQEMARYGK